MNPIPEYHNLVNRRLLLRGAASSIGVAALSSLMSQSGVAATNGQIFGGTHFAPRAKRVVYLFQSGGPSHLELFDSKTKLRDLHGTELPDSIRRGQRLTGMTSGQKSFPVIAPKFGFRRCGEAGTWLSELLPHTGRVMDDICMIRSMHTEAINHDPAITLIQTGSQQPGRPSMGAWISYGLGSMTDELPTYVAIPDIRGEPPNGKANWSNGFLPARHQAIVMAAQQPIRNLKTPDSISVQEEKQTRDLLSFLNKNHASQRPAESELQARIGAYELAARMQLSAPDVSDFSKEPKHIHQLYGTDSKNSLTASYASNCLLARRLLERDVRYVSLYCASRASGVDGLLNWDAHKTLKADYERHFPIFDQPTAALLTDLKQNGLLEDTLVLWTTEFGRMPTSQQGTAGRDHNPDGFTLWMMGAGVKGGISYGATDQFGRRAEKNPTTIWEFHSTVLHLMGLDFNQLSWYYNGLDRRLTDVHGHVIKQVLA